MVKCAGYGGERLSANESRYQRRTTGFYRAFAVWKNKPKLRRISEIKYFDLNILEKSFTFWYGDRKSR